MPKTECSILQFLGKFRAAFTQRSFPVAVQLVVGLLLAGGSHTLAAGIRVLRCLGGEGHFSRFYRFFTAHRWFPEVLTGLLVRCALELIKDQPVIIVVDDTLVEHRGPQIWGIGMHYDAPRSTYGRGDGPRIGRVACGHNWVVASLVVPMPWGSRRFRALPVAAKLYRNAKQAGDAYRKRTELGAELVKHICRHIPSHLAVVLVGDSTYTCCTVARAVSPRVSMVGPLPRNAALTQLPTPPDKPQRGRPRKYGTPLPCPAKLFEASTTQWRQTKVHIYGRSVTLEVADWVAQWPSVFGARPVRIVLTRSPRGRWRPTAWVSSDPDMTAEQVVERYALRWSAEVMHRELKQQLGAGAIQNGWYRRVRKAKEPLPEPPGPRPHPQRGRRAVERTFPFLLFIYSVLHLWYVRAARSATDVATHRADAPWYRHKYTPSFGDMLCAARATILSHYFPDPTDPRFQEKIHQLIRAIAAPG